MNTELLPVNQSSLTLDQWLFVKYYVMTKGNLTKTKTLLDDEGSNHKIETLKSWLEFEPVKNQLLTKLNDLAIDINLTKEQWVRETIEFRDGEKRLDKTGCFMHKLLGLAKGFIQSTGGSVNVEKQLINFTYKE